MNDKERLIAAARAAGLPVFASGATGLRVLSDGCASGYIWNPLTNDGDALRLAVKLNLNMEYMSEPDGAEVWVSDAWSDTVVVQTEPLGKDPLTATRRAIVRAAAEIGLLHNARATAQSGANVAVERDVMQGATTEKSND